MNAEFEALEKENATLRKINRVLMDRVENSVNSTGNNYAIFENNILLQKQVEQRTAELEQRNRQLAALLSEQKIISEELYAGEQRAVVQRVALAQLMVDPEHMAGGTSQFLQQITKVLAETVGVARASIWRLSDDRATLICQTLYDARTQTQANGAILVTGASPAYFKALEVDTRIFAEDAQSDPRTCELAESYLKPLGIVSLLDAGILVEGRLAGVVSIEHVGDRRKWHPDEESFVAAIGAIVAQWLVNTERKRAEAGLQESEAQKNAILNGISTNIALVDKNLKILWANKAAADSVNQRAHDMVGHTCYSFWGDAVKPCGVCPAFKAFQTGKSEHKIVETPDGRIWDEGGEPVFDGAGNVVAVVEIAQDITDRTRSEEALRESETRFKALHNASFGGIAIHDQGRILDCNHGLSELSGYSFDELIGMNGLLLISEKSRDMVVGHIVAQYEKPYEAIGVRKNGTEYPLRLEGRKIPYRGKEVRVVEFRDITEQKKLETELSDARILLNAAIEQSPVPMALATVPDGKLRIINRATENFLQIKAADYLDKTLSEIPVTWQEYSPAGLPVSAAELPLPRALNGQTTKSMEMRIDVADGRQQWQMASGAPIYSDSGELIAGLLIMQNITEQKQAEAALRASESRFKTMVDNSGDIIQTMGIAGKASFVSGQVETILGYSEAEILAMDSTLAGIHPDDLPHVVRTLQASIPIPDAKGRVEYRFRHKDGRWIWLEATGTNLLHNPMVGGLFLIIQDISARKQAEAALRESEEKLSALFASMTEMVVLHEVVLDDAGQPINYRITDCNQAFTEVTGIAREAAVGKLATEVYGVAEPPYLQEFCQVAITGETYHFETFFAPMDKYFSISVVSPGKNRFATVTNDISDAKKIQHIIAAKNKELEQLVYVASHDLRSPLVNVDGYGRELEYAAGEIIQALECGDLSENKLETLLRAQLPDITGALRHIRNSTRQMDGLLKGLLKLSRLGRSALEIRPLNMNELLARVASTFQYQIREAGADLRVANLPPCQGDDVQVVQVFANLIGNALKFREPTRPVVITVSGVAEYGRCVYCVADNGIGIAPDKLEKIFELFHRLDPTKTEGEGLGLTIVRQILGRLHGEIRVESTPGVGSCFTVSLPKESASQMENTEASS